MTPDLQLKYVTLLKLLSFSLNLRDPDCWLLLNKGGEKHSVLLVALDRPVLD